MLGTKDLQYTFADADNWQERIPQNSFYYQVRQWVEENLSDEQFDHFYSEGKGRPSLSPTRMLTAIMIQLEKGYSDREMDEIAQFDDRVKFALKLSRTPQCRITHASLSNYRKLFLYDDTARQMLKTTLQTATAAGLFDNADKDLVDSFMIHGATSKRDTYTLIRMAMAHVLRLAKQEDMRHKIEPLLEYKEYEKKGKPKIDWENQSAKQELLATLVNDARRVKEFSANNPLSRELKDAINLLQLVAEQDIEEKDGQIKIRQGVAKDRIISIKDPEMRHGHKTTSSKTDGYKGNIMTGGQDYALITAVIATPANAPDGSVLEALLEQRKDNLGEYPEKLLGDTAYGGADIRKDMLDKEIALIAKVPPAVNKSNLFTKDEFIIDLQAGLITCPANHTISMIPTGKGKKQTERAAQGVFRFPEKTCKDCPMRDECTKSKSGRTIRIHEHEALLQTARAQQKTPEFKNKYSVRANVERSIAHITRHGARTTRLVGKERAQFKLAVHGAVRNIITIFKYMAGNDKTKIDEPATG